MKGWKNKCLEEGDGEVILAVEASILRIVYEHNVSSLYTVV